MNLRPYQSSDVGHLLRVFREAVRVLGPREYGPEQVAAWAGVGNNVATFRERLARGCVLVAESHGEPVAFGQLHPADGLEMLYCDPQWIGQGLGKRLLTALENKAQAAGQILLETRASLLARGFFEKHGFARIRSETVDRGGVAIPRCVMRKCLLKPPPTRWVILGNAGSGKTTLARRIAEMRGASQLDLDTIAWQPDASNPQRRSIADSRRDIRRFCDEHSIWVVEGCYDDLAHGTFDYDPCLVWLRPSVEACVERCRWRAFEPHKFSTAAEQEAALPALLQWVAEYPTRDGPMSEAAHRSLFESYSGRKCEVSDPRTVATAETLTNDEQP